MKKILTLGPVMPQASDIEAIAATFSFLDKDYQIDYLDPLSIQEALANEAYYRLWEKELKEYIKAYDAFFGFSFGGVILQQCFHLFEGQNKKIVLFSTPTFADSDLQDKLGRVVALCKERQISKALYCLYEDVFYPNPSPLQFSELVNEERIASRLIFGLQRVLDSDSSSILASVKVDHLHLIGELSHLVNKANVHAPAVGRLELVPAASMRVLQDNPQFSQNAILQYLNSGVPL